MVKLNKIYTKTGDDGTTGLVSGKRVSKDDARIKAFGAVDEVNAVIGVVRVCLKKTEPVGEGSHALELDDMLARIQNDLFDLGADLATPHEDDMKFEPLRIQDSQVLRLETEIDDLNDKLEPLTSFVLPGGTELAAYLHMARTITRRAERHATTLGQADDKLNSAALSYLNRLSDLLFVMGRIVNDYGRADILWVPGQNR